jgi:hypothetical protein
MELQTVGRERDSGRAIQPSKLSADLRTF